MSFKLFECNIKSWEDRVPAVTVVVIIISNAEPENLKITIEQFFIFDCKF